MGVGKKADRLERFSLTIYAIYQKRGNTIYDYYRAMALLDVMYKTVAGKEGRVYSGRVKNLSSKAKEKYGCDTYKMNIIEK